MHFISSQKLLKFSDLFHRKSILLKSTNGQVAISQKEINSKQEFKVLINKHPINLNSIINYNFFFQNSVHNGGDVKIEKGFYWFDFDTEFDYCSEKMN